MTNAVLCILYQTVAIFLLVEEALSSFLQAM